MIYIPMPISNNRRLFLLLHLFSIQVAVSKCTESLDSCEMGENEKKMNGCDSTETPTQSSQALMIYDESLLTPFQKEQRTFHFSNTTLVIKQDWSSLGVAAVVWDAAIVLCEYLEKNEISLANKSVIELGAGSGLVGIVAALLGAEVTITERKIALDYLNTVVTQNVDLTKVKVSVRELDWTQKLTEYTKKYDIIVGADIIYIEDLFPDLLKTLKHLSDYDTVILISCHIRYNRDQKFLNMMKENFLIEEVFYDKSRNIHIYKAQKNT